MEIVKAGYEYRLANFQSSDTQRIVFTEKTEEGFVDGTTNEEVVDALIDRFYALNNKRAHRDNYLVIYMLKNIRRLLAQRVDRKVKKLASHGKKNQFEGR